MICVQKMNFSFPFILILCLYTVLNPTVVWLHLNASEMNTIVGYIYDMLYGSNGGYPSYASAAAIILFVIVLTITCINLTVSKKYVHY